MKHPKITRTLQDQLLSNAFPYPDHYDGRSFSTSQPNKRKHIPNYLREGLPTSKFNKIRQKFREMDKFAPPEIKYFERYIKQSHSPTKRLKSCRIKSNQRKHLEEDLNHMNEEMQYALVMVDRESNVLVDLLEKASKMEDSKKKLQNVVKMPFQKKLVKSKIDRRSKLGCHTQKFFGNTVDLVFGLKKKQCAQRLKAKSLSFIPDQFIEEKIGCIRLQTYSFDKRQS